MVGNAEPDRHRARLQGRLGRLQVQRKVRRLATLGRSRRTPAANDGGVPLGEIAKHRLRQSEPSIMKKFGKPQFLLHYRELLESPAWLGLSPRALKVLGRLELEHLRHGGQDNGKLPVIYDDFQALGIS